MHIIITLYTYIHICIHVTCRTSLSSVFLTPHIIFSSVESPDDIMVLNLLISNGTPNDTPVEL